jgi:hypothetical protein
MNLGDVFSHSMTRRMKLQDMNKTKVDCLEDYQKYMENA